MRFLLDEMLPPGAAQLLRDDGHEAFHAREMGLAGAPDADVAAAARSAQRALVTENVVDFVREPDIILVCVLKRRLPPGGAQAVALARLLAAWAERNPQPYIGQHWPTADDIGG